MRIEREKLLARGHPNIEAKHEKTMALTCHEKVSRRGDCFIGLGASKSLADFSTDFKKLASNKKANIRMEIRIEGLDEGIIVEGRGRSSLSYSHPKDIVIRKSGFVCPKTVMVYADKAAGDLSRSFVKLLQKPETVIKIVFTVTLGSE